MLRAIRICGAVVRTFKNRGMEKLVEPVFHDGRYSSHSRDSEAFVRLVRKAERLAGSRSGGPCYKGYAFAY